MSCCCCAGTKLLSGSDDTLLGVWDVARRKKIKALRTGHTANIFCTRFMPGTGALLFLGTRRGKPTACTCPAIPIPLVKRMAVCHKGLAHLLSGYDLLPAGTGQCSMHALP